MIHAKRQTIKINSHTASIIVALQRKDPLNKGDRAQGRSSKSDR